MAAADPVRELDLNAPGGPTWRAGAQWAALPADRRRRLTRHLRRGTAAADLDDARLLVAVADWTWRAKRIRLRAATLLVGAGCLVVLMATRSFYATAPVTVAGLVVVGAEYAALARLRDAGRVNRAVLARAGNSAEPRSGA